jgi:sec-independent protein translocase protein TatB
MNFGVSGEMIFLFLLVLILFGPKKMPEIGRQVARLLNEFRRASNEFRSQIESEVNSLDTSANRATYRNSNQQILPSLQAPLGSLANRIFNPPSAEKLQAVEEAAAEDAAVKAAAAESVARKDAIEVTSTPEPSPAPKVAPDA